MFFLKNIKNKALSFLLVKKMGNDFSGNKIWSKTDDPSQNYGLTTFLFRVTDSYMHMLP